MQRGIHDVSVSGQACCLRLLSTGSSGGISSRLRSCVCSANPSAPAVDGAVRGACAAAATDAAAATGAAEATGACAAADVAATSVAAVAAVAGGGSVLLFMAHVGL